jgi:hypothetical protein
VLRTEEKEYWSDGVLVKRSRAKGTGHKGKEVMSFEFLVLSSS